MKRVIATCLVAAASASLLSFSVQAGNYYRWTNERGNVVHSDRPPPQGVDYEVVSTMSTQTRQVDADEGAVAPVTEPDQGKQSAAAPVPKLEPQILKNPEKCAAARKNLAMLDSRARIRMKNKEGEMVFLTPDEQEVQRQRALDTIEVHCE